MVNQKAKHILKLLGLFQKDPITKETTTGQKWNYLGNNGNNSLGKNHIKYI